MLLPDFIERQIDDLVLVWSWPGPDL